MLTHLFRRLILSLLLYVPYSLLASAQTDQIVHGIQRISIHYHPSLTETERKITFKWLQKVSNALRTVYGEFPKDSFRLTIKKSSRRSGPVPWGHVERGEPTNVLLVINPRHGYDVLVNDWTAFHELSHLLIPYRGHGNIWFSEGLATYYQNIIQARSGLLDETEMWTKIAAGFERGKKQQRWNHINLSQVSDRMRENRQFMRVYWSGVLYWLHADIELRQQNKGSLDDALERLKTCCESHSMSAKGIARKLDILTRANVFIPLFDEYSTSYQIPNYQTILTDLGIQASKWGLGIELHNDAPLATIRQKIYRR